MNASNSNHTHANSVKFNPKGAGIDVRLPVLCAMTMLSNANMSST